MIGVAAIQFASLHDKDKNIHHALSLIKQAKEKGADIILLQELFAYDYFCQIEDYNFFSLAEEKDNSTIINFFKDVAKEYNVVLPISFFEKDINSYYNSLALISNKGEVLGYYRKTHIPTGAGYEEKFYFAPGDTGYKVFKTDFGNIGIGICWDQWFSETGRILALKGADFIFFPTAIGSEPVTNEDSSSHWKNALIGQAALNMVPVIASNRIGTESFNSSQQTFYGTSLIIDGDGNVVKEASRDKEEVLVYKFDLEKNRNHRRDWGIYRDRRPECYRDILKRESED